MPVVITRIRRSAALVRVEDPVDRAVALGVDADLPAGGMRPSDRRPEGVLGLPVQGARELAIAPVRRREGGRPTRQRPIRVELHRTDPESVVPERPRQPEGFVGIELRGDRHGRHTDTEQAPAARLAVRVQLAPSHLGVDDRRDPRGEIRANPALDVATTSSSVASSWKPGP